ncbi:hypothetical protein [Metabacillus malikii]|uniref:Type IV secretory pathway VirB10-like protein n=1 Tax=Metabacillus malikii TaxID=1504265 RepID=A0ABT9ZMW8_9BACI|nr:hypothetical protein [Metabacillus malikii]MDQ0233621.1 type IV secretory pathway VirB10-like protein [Metabacillus malikii]
MSKARVQAFAAGMIVATSLLGVTYYLSDKQTDNTKKEITEKEVDTFLTEKGKMSIDTVEYEEYLATKDTANQEKEPAETPKENSTPAKEETPPQAETPAKEETPPQEEAPEKKEEEKKYTLTISEGMTTSAVSDLLEQNGIIEDSFEFSQFLIKNNYHQRVQLGTFEVKKGMDYNQLAQAITK